MYAANSLFKEPHFDRRPSAFNSGSVVERAAGFTSVGNLHFSTANSAWMPPSRPFEAALRFFGLRAAQAPGITLTEFIGPPSEKLRRTKIQAEIIVVNSI